MMNEAMDEVRKLRLWLSQLEEADGQVHVSLRLCLDKWQKLIEGLDRALPPTSGASESRLEAIEALRDALEMESRAEHERRHIAEGMGRLLWKTDRASQNKS
jgi:hypothetical protein